MKRTLLILAILSFLPLTVEAGRWRGLIASVAAIETAKKPVEEPEKTAEVPPRIVEVPPRIVEVPKNPETCTSDSCFSPDGVGVTANILPDNTVKAGAPTPKKSSKKRFSLFRRLFRRCR